MTTETDAQENQALIGPASKQLWPLANRGLVAETLGETYGTKVLVDPRELAISFAGGRS